VIHLKLVDTPDPSVDFVRNGGHFHLYLESQNVDAMATHLRSHGVRLEQEPTDTDWQTRELIFRDDQGHTIYVGQPKSASAV
jgi:uncharacterized glyoxalase superfamily protein PhnB